MDHHRSPFFRRTSQFFPRFTTGSSLLLVLSAVVFCADATASGNGEDIFSSFGDENFVSIATGRKQTLKRAPAVASVITAEDIRAMGARDLDEVLETVPGLHVARNSLGYNPIYVIRGIFSEFNPQVLMLVNGIPITNLFVGDRGQVWGGFPLESVLRIEVIRGPGSAIYGADAYAGTINIITKSATEDNTGTETGVSYGSFDERRAWITSQHTTDSGFKVFASLEYLKTDGPAERVEADGQTALDATLAGAPYFASPVSLAPGKTSLRRETWDSRLEIQKDLVTFRAGYQERNNFGLGAGANQILDPNGEANATRINADLTYHDPNFSEHWDVQAQLSHFDVDTTSDLILYPPGAFAGSFPDGVIGQPSGKERASRFEVSGFYSGIDSHELRIGTGYQYLEQYEVSESKNFEIQLDINGNPLVIPLGGLQDVSDTEPFNQEEDRQIYYLFLQDEWNIAPDWALTLGLRYDDYSDFGDTVNPRLAVVWQTSYALTSKFLYGRAFRAPSFQELFNINNPVAVGNPDLDPEVIDTYELAFNYTVSSSLHFGLNLFYYKMKDVIRFDPSVAENAGDQVGHGLELEANWKPTDRLLVSGNYSWQDSESRQNFQGHNTRRDAPNAPGQQIYLQTNYEYLTGWFANLQVNHVMDRKRSASDPRSDVDDYTKVDLFLRATQLIPDWEFSVGIRNLADEEIYEPSIETPANIPGDLPQAGRSYFARISTRF